MGYITAEYYNDTFMGSDAGDNIHRLIDIASDTLDHVTGYKLQGKDLETDYNDFIVEQVKKATASQVEYLVLNGGVESLHSGEYSQVSLGNFSYNESEGKSEKPSMISTMMLRYLSPTGLLYNGVDSYG